MDRTDEDRANHITVWLDAHGELNVECRFRFTDAEQMAADFHPLDRHRLRMLDTAGASLAERLEALSILVAARDARVSP